MVNLANNGVKQIIKYKNNHHSTIGFILSGPIELTNCHFFEIVLAYCVHF